jgi:hypothetical protein
MMNSPFVVDQARHLAARAELAAMKDPARRIRYVYRLLFGRLPSADEVALGLRFVQSPVASRQPPAGTTGSAPGKGAVMLTSTGKAATSGSPAPADAASSLLPWEQYIQVLLMTNEFAFVD